MCACAICISSHSRAARCCCWCDVYAAHTAHTAFLSKFRAQTRTSASKGWVLARSAWVAAST